MFMMRWALDGTRDMNEVWGEGEGGGGKGREGGCVDYGREGSWKLSVD